MALLQDIGPNFLLWGLILSCLLTPSARRIFRLLGVLLLIASTPAAPMFISLLFQDVGDTEAAPPGKEFVAIFGGGVSDLPAVGGWPNSETVRRVASGLSEAKTRQIPIAFSGGVSGDGASSEAAAVRERIGLPDGTLADETARTTFENAQAFARFAADKGWTHAVVATSPTHRRRAAAMLRAMGVRIAGVAKAGDSGGIPAYRRYIPSLTGLNLWRRPTYETAAIISYLAHGRISPGDLW